MAMAERTYAVFVSTPADVQTTTPQSIYAIILADAQNRDGTLTEEEFMRRFGDQSIWFQIQNKDATNSLYLTDADAVANAHIEILPTQSKLYPTILASKYFMRDHFVDVGTNGQVFSIEVQFA